MLKLFFMVFLWFYIFATVCTVWINFTEDILLYIICFEETLQSPVFLQSIIIYVPMPKLKAFQKIQTRLVRELEKKFSGKHVMFIGERKILPKPTRKTRTKNKQKRP